MREIKIRIGVDEKTNKIIVIEETAIGIPEGIDKEIWLQGIYHQLALRHHDKLKTKNRIKIIEPK